MIYLEGGQITPRLTLPGYDAIMPKFYHMSMIENLRGK